MSDILAVFVLTLLGFALWADEGACLTYSVDGKPPIRRCLKLGR